MNKEKILGISNKDNLMHEIRNIILPMSFGDKGEMSKVFAELNKVLKVDDIIRF